MKEQDNEWTTIVKPQSSLFDLNLSALWKYRDLILLFVKRDFVSVYKQTILGPLWYIIQPVLTTITFSVIFGTIAKISTGSVPAPLFYMSGIVCWNFFSSSVIKTSNTFVTNANIFGKVYFPRLTVPVSVIISNLISFSIQFLIFIGFLVYYLSKSAPVHINMNLIGFFPFLIILTCTLSLGMGIIISSLTTKYRDLSFLVGFGMQLLMYCSSVVFPLSAVSDKYKIYIAANPMSAIITMFRDTFLTTGETNFTHIAYSTAFAIIILIIGIITFNRVEKGFADTV